MFRIVRFPKKLENFFDFFKDLFKHNQHFYFRIFTLLIAFSPCRKTVASLYRQHEPEYEISCYNNFLKYGQLGPSRTPTFDGIPPSRISKA